MSMLDNRQAEQEWNKSYETRLKRLVRLTYGDRPNPDIVLMLDNDDYRLGQLLKEQIDILQEMVQQRERYANQRHRNRRPVKYFKDQLASYRSALRCWELEVAAWWDAQQQLQSPVRQAADAH